MSAVSPPHAAPLSQLLGGCADAVQAVRDGRSLNDVLAKVPAESRGGVQALSFHTLRWLGSATLARQQLAPKTPPPQIDSLLVTALALLWPGEPPPYAEHTLVDQAVITARQRLPAAAGFVNAVLRRFLRERDTIAADVRHNPVGAYNHPLWWIERIRRDWPRDWQRLLLAANQRPPMTLRVNTRRGSADNYRLRLAALGRQGRLLSGAEAPERWTHLPAEHGAARPDSLNQAQAQALGQALGEALAQALVLDQPSPVQQLLGFAEGECSVQDAAAQLAAPLLLHGLKPGARVLDACAAPGGKTAHLLELADLDLLALDSDPVRLVRVREGLQRLRLPAPAAGGTGSRLQVAVGDARNPATWWDGRPFDAILLDAPCTASGIVRRHPDVRWLRRAEDVNALVRVQAELLDALWPLLASGGRLLYVTCSLFKAEGEQQIDAFLQRLGSGRASLDPRSPGHLLTSHDNAGLGPGMHMRVPQDGFFYALLHKHAPA